MRPLSSVERAFWLLDRATSFNGVNVARFRGSIGEAHVRSALEWVRARHPLMRVGIRDPEFVAVDAPLPFTVVKRRDADHWREIERAEINQRYQENQLLWRAVFLQGEGEHELVISHQHVIADAQSAVVKMREIVAALGAAVDGKPLPLPESLPLRPAMSTMLGAPLKHFGAMNWFFFRNLIARGLRPARKLDLDEKAEFSTRRLNIAHLDLDEEATAALARRCKQEKTSVQGALCAAMLLAAAQSMGVDDARLACFSAVTLRDRLGIGDEMGLYTSQVTTWHRVGRELWDLAREVKRDLQRTIQWGEHLVTIPMIGMFIPFGKNPAPKLARRLDLASPATVGLSNIGRIEVPKRAGPVELLWFHLAVGPSVVAPLAACAATVHGRLAMSVVFVEPLVSESRARALTEATREILLQNLSIRPLAVTSTGRASESRIAPDM